jgi:hypothetical protein
LLKSIRITLISRDSRPNSEEEEKEKLIIMLEKDLPSKTKINSTLWNTDSSQDSPTKKLLLKSSMLP